MMLLLGWDTHLNSISTTRKVFLSECTKGSKDPVNHRSVKDSSQLIYSYEVIHITLSPFIFWFLG